MALLPVKLPANIGATLRQQQAEEQGHCGGGHHHGLFLGVSHRLEVE